MARGSAQAQVRPCGNPGRDGDGSHSGELKRIGVAPAGRPSTMRMSRHPGTTVQSSPGRPPVFTRSSLRDGPRSAFPEKCAACSAAHQGRSSPAGSLFHAGHRVRRVRPAISAPVKPAHRQRALPILAPLFRCRESDRPMPPPAHGRGNSRQLTYERGFDQQRCGRPAILRFVAPGLASRFGTWWRTASSVSLFAPRPALLLMKG